VTTHHDVFFRTGVSLEPVTSNSVHLVVTSPPYPMIEMWDDSFAGQDASIGDVLTAGDGDAAFELMHRLLDHVWRECARVVRDGGFLCVNIGDATRTVGGGFRLYTNHSRITTACEALGFQSLPAIIWRKQTNAPNKFMGSGMLPSGAYVTLEHEYILIFRKGGKRSFHGPERARRRRSAFFWEERNVWFSDLWDFKGTPQRMLQNDARARSGAFPFELVFRLICMYSLQEDRVLDPFLGTGTTMLAAMAAGRHSIGIELESGLRGTIEESIGANARALNERQHRRATEHNAFLARYEHERGHPPAHTNVPHGIPVVTGQEADMSIPVVAAIRALDDAAPEALAYEVEHEQLDWPRGETPGDGPSGVSLTGIDSGRAESDDQLDLF
jgi:DNA modification methylase